MGIEGSTWVSVASGIPERLLVAAEGIEGLLGFLRIIAGHPGILNSTAEHPGCRSVGDLHGSLVIIGLPVKVGIAGLPYYLGTTADRLEAQRRVAEWLRRITAHPAK
jgi:hypothetical protein